MVVAVAGVRAVVADLVVAELVVLAVVAVVVREAAVPSSPRVVTLVGRGGGAGRRSRRCARARGGGGARGGRRAAVVVREAAVPSSPRWRWSPRSSWRCCGGPGDPELDTIAVNSAAVAIRVR